MSEILKIFPISIFKSKVRDNNYLKELLVDKISENSTKLKSPDGWTTNNIKTSYNGEPEGFELFFQGSEYVKILKESYLNTLDDIFDREYSVLIYDMWYNYYSDGEYQEDHNHLGSVFKPIHFSCIHFLSFDSTQHTPPHFVDPLSQLRTFSFELDKSEYNDTFIPQIEEGDFLVFPSYLTHGVSPCVKTNYPRITISFNINIHAYGEEKLEFY
jgi:hypothetical protein